MGTEFLGNGVKLYTTRDYSFGTDAILLADFANPPVRGKACDLGTGCGIIPLLWARTSSMLTVSAVDIQEEAIRLMRRSVDESGLNHRIFPVCADLRHLNGVLENSSFDLVTMNPPYKMVGTGVGTDRIPRRIARFEVFCTPEDMADAAFRLLKPNGRFCLCQRPERLPDVISALRTHGLEPKRFQMVSQVFGKEPFLFLMEARKNGRKGLRVLPEFCLYTKDGRPTEETEKLYRVWREEAAFEEQKKQGE